MKVLQINSVCGIRSTGRICTDIADILKESGDDCRVAYGRESVPENYNDIAVRIGNDADVNSHALMSRVFDNTGRGSKNATRKFLKWVDEYNPDVIHLHNLHGYYINLELLFQYLKKVQKPVVWTLHDCWAFTGHCAHFDLIGCNRWENGGCYDCPQKKRYPTSMVFDRSKKNFVEKKQLFLGINDMTIVTPSQWLADLVKRSFLGCYPIQVIHNGIDLNVFKPTYGGNFREKYGLQDKKILLGVASSWGISKGLDVFVELSKRLTNQYKIVLIGTNDAIDAKLPDGILSIHRTNDKYALTQIYTEADVFVNPTRAEVFGLVNIEALACGVPGVTFRSGGSPECYDNTCGVVVEKNDIDAMEREIIQICNSKPFKPEACVRFARNFDMYEKYQNYLKLYHSNFDLFN